MSDELKIEVSLDTEQQQVMGKLSDACVEAAVSVINSALALELNAPSRALYERIGNIIEHRDAVPGDELIVSWRMTAAEPPTAEVVVKARFTKPPREIVLARIESLVAWKDLH